SIVYSSVNRSAHHAGGAFRAPAGTGPGSKSEKLPATTATSCLVGQDGGHRRKSTGPEKGIEIQSAANRPATTRLRAAMPCFADAPDAGFCAARRATLVGALFTVGESTQP